MTEIQDFLYDGGNGRIYEKHPPNTEFPDEDEYAEMRFLSNQEEWLRKLYRKCERCKFRFKCYTTNTAERPEKLKGINFEVAKCCLRCTDSKFRRTKEGYRQMGKCILHGVAVHQFSVCKAFEPKRSDTLTYKVYHELEIELKFIAPNYGLPRFCITDKKFIP